MITCIAIDDEPMALEVIERYCAKSDLVELKAVFREPVKAKVTWRKSGEIKAYALDNAGARVAPVPLER